jgi:hypothetical protein
MSKWVWCILMLRKLTYKGKHNEELAIWVYSQKQKKINQNKNFKCAKVAVSWVKRHRSYCQLTGMKVNVPFPDTVYFARILADRHAEISSLFLMRQIRLLLIDSAFQCQLISLYWVWFPVGFWIKQFSFFEMSHLFINCFGRSNLKSQNHFAIFTNTYQPYCFENSLK